MFVYCLTYNEDIPIWNCIYILYYFNTTQETKERNSLKKGKGEDKIPKYSAWPMSSKLTMLSKSNLSFEVFLFFIKCLKISKNHHTCWAISVNFTYWCLFWRIEKRTSNQLHPNLMHFAMFYELINGYDALNLRWFPQCFHRPNVGKNLLKWGWNQFHHSKYVCWLLIEFVLSLSYFECKCVWFGRKWRKGEETEKKKGLKYRSCKDFSKKGKISRRLKK